MNKVLHFIEENINEDIKKVFMMTGFFNLFTIK